MKDIKWNEIIDRLKHTFTGKRTKITLYIVIVLWVAVGAQMVMNRIFTQPVQITEAFVKSDTAEMQSSLQIIAEYNKQTLNEDGKSNIIYSLADAIGLVIDNDITVWKEASRSESYYYKKAKKASTQLKVASVEDKKGTSSEVKHYIIVKLSVLDSIKSIDHYKKNLEKVIKEIGATNIQTTVKYEGCKAGNLTAEQKHEIAKRLIKELQGEIAMEYDEGDLYTVYGYTGLLNEYVKSMGNKINVQIAITYNELTNKSTITLATPIINESY